jgi:hypothetical protein
MLKSFKNIKTSVTEVERMLKMLAKILDSKHLDP